MQPDGLASFLRAAEDQEYRAGVIDDVEYQGSARELVVQELSVGRADRGVGFDVTVSQTIENATSMPGTTSFLVTTGLWTETPHTAGIGDNRQFELQWQDAVVPGRFFDEAGVVKATEDDRAFAVVRMPTVVAPSYLRVTAACEHDDLSEIGNLGTGAQLSCSALPVAAQCVQVRAPHTEALAHVASAVAPAVYTKQRYGWSVMAVPAPEVHPQFGLTLADKSIFPQDAGIPAVDWNEPVDHGNPYPGHAVSVRTFAARDRSVTAPNSTSATLTAQTTTWPVPGAACGAEAPAVPLAPFAVTAILAGQALTADGQRVVLDRSAAALLEWTTAGAGEVDYYEVVITEIDPVLGGTFIAPRRTYLTTAPALHVEPDLIEAGKLYTFSIASHVGYPLAGAGDFVTLAYPAAPLAISKTWTATFVAD